MNSNRMTMAGWTDARTEAETLTTADESQDHEITIAQHQQNQRLGRQEEAKPEPTKKSVQIDAPETPPTGSKKKSYRRIMIVLGVMVVICAGLAIGFHFHNQSVLDDEQRTSASALATNDGTDTRGDDADAPSVSVEPQAPTSSPTVATTLPPTLTPSASPTLTTIVVDAPFSTETPSAAPTQVVTSAPNVDSTADTPLTPSTMPAVTTNPSLRPSLRPNVIVPSIAPSSFPTTVATNVATNQQATLNPTVPPTMLTTTDDRIGFDPTPNPTVPPTILTNTNETVSAAPTANPTATTSPTATANPTASPTMVTATNETVSSAPTDNPTATAIPTVPPTMVTTTTNETISSAPTGTPSLQSSDSPSSVPTAAVSTEEPTVEASFGPTSTPSLRASATPTNTPIAAPTSSSPTGSPTSEDSSVPTVSPTTPPPTETPTTSPPTDSPTSRPTQAITPAPTSDEFSRVVIEPDRRLNQGDFVFSPNGRYRIGLTEDIGDFQLVDTTTDEIVWNANITGGYRAYMQGDGNCIIRNESGKGLWSTKTSKNYDSQLVLDNGGMLGILYNESYLWIQGVPRDTYDDSTIGVPSSNDIQFPIRGAFYYPWYPETWTAGGEMAIFEPDDPLGYYNSADPAVVEAHLDHFEYGNIELGIASWWGPSKNNDRARISLIQNMTQARGSNLKWSVYYEEMDKFKPLEEVISDLAYLKKWYTWHDTWAKVDGKPVIFVYHNRGCHNSERWMEAANGEWHVVLKLFGGFIDCPTQPSSWHNYGPAKEVLSYDGHSHSISPGFWHAAEAEPVLPRVNQTRFCEMVQEMVDSQIPWQLVTTFNEAGEGTMIEPSASWASDSGYGYYLDCLHDIY